MLKGIVMFFILAFPFSAWAQDLFPSTDQVQNSFASKEGPSTVELQGDKVSYSAADNKAKASGNVTIKGKGATLSADDIEVDRSKNRATADGNVYLETATTQIDAKKAVYNFDQSTGTFEDAKIANNPFYLNGKQIDKVTETSYQMTDGYLTTCDHDQPHFCLKTRRLDYYQNDKAVARGIRLYIGRIPVMYLPKYTFGLKCEPWITFIPGKKKDFGLFLLTTIRLKINQNAKLILHVDYRERKGIAEGFDYKYSTPRTGSGIIKTYYINEYTYPGKHPWIKEDGVKPTTRERYKAEWRHKWNPDDRTSIITQYFRMKDPTFLKEYFERQYRNNPDINTYFLLTRTLPHGTLSFNIDASRVNRYNRGVEKFPEIKYDLNNTEIGETGLYVKSQNTFSNLVKKEENPENHRKTIRMDTNNELSYPMKIAFIETRPFTGVQSTYYSRTNTLDKRNIVRNVFRLGTDVSTKSYKVWNVNSEKFKINKLRHVMTPSFTYMFQHRPTVVPGRLNQFDSIDSVDRLHAFRLAFENKLQTKRKNVAVDLVRLLLSTDFFLKEDTTAKSGFSTYRADLEIRPTDWLSFNSEAAYDHKNDRIDTLNFETFINHGDKWSFGIGRRYTFDVDDQYTAELNYKFNPLWKVKIYERMDVNTGTLKEESYVLTRDLHEWEMDITYNQLHGSGSDILLVFRLKAFPDMDLDFASAGFNKPRPGAQ